MLFMGGFGRMLDCFRFDRCDGRVCLGLRRRVPAGNHRRRYVLFRPDFGNDRLEHVLEHVDVTGPEQRTYRVRNPDQAANRGKKRQNHQRNGHRPRGFVRLEIVRQVVMLVVVIVIMVVVRAIVVVVVVRRMCVICFIVRGVTRCKSVFFRVSGITGMFRVGQGLVKAFCAEERHPHHPRHINGGQNGRYKPDDPEDDTPNFRAARESDAKVL